METLRSVNIEGFKPVDRPKLKAPRLEWVAIEHLVIDDRYQRPLTAAGRTAIRKIAENFLWSKFQPILVSPLPEGRFAIVDGQHRAFAAALAGFDAIPAMIVEMSLEEQALGFAAVNRDRIKVDGLGVYRAELAAGSEWALQCKDAVEAGRCWLATSNGSSWSKKPGAIYAIGLIRKMVSRGEAEAVSVGLSAIRGAICGTDPYLYGGPVLNVWLTAISTNQRFLKMPLAAVLDQIDIESVLDRAKVDARVSGRSARDIATERIVGCLRLQSQRTKQGEGPAAAGTAADTGDAST